MRLLLIEDEKVLADRLALGLRRLGHAVDVAYDGRHGLDVAISHEHDVVVLDRDLPGLHGDDLCRSLVAGPDFEGRILMLTASGTVEDRVEGLGIGADDYLGKPFDFRELVARIEALGRRARRRLRTLSKGDLLVDLERKLVTRGGLPVDLTPKEYGLLVALLEADGRPVSAERLLEQVWDEFADSFSQTVRVTMARLRAKLGDPPLIDTVVGVGYRI